jgi:glycosyltransferase involved in cell wall biosynthesis
MGAWSTLYAFEAANLKGKLPYKTVVHSIYHIMPKEMLKWETCLGILSRVDAVTTSTPWEQNAFKSCGLSRVFFIGEGVDVDHIRAKQLDHSAGDKFTITFLGPRSYHKGYYHGVLAVNNLCRRVGYHNVQMVVIGREIIEPVPLNLKRKALNAYKDLKQHGCIDEHSFVSEEEKIKYLCKTDVVLLPSIAETIPLVALEAWALEKPSLLCDIPTVRSVIGQEGNGALLVKFGDVAEIQKKLEVLYENKNLLASVGLRGYQILMNFGSLKNISERLIRTYTNLTRFGHKNLYSIGKV